MSKKTIITDENIHDLVVAKCFNDNDFLPQDLRDLQIGQWDVSRVTNMDDLFYDQQEFNEPIGGWDVSHVTSMVNMFRGATVFNQPIGSWDVSRVTNMCSMFKETAAFNQPIGGWDVSRVTDMSSMFENALAFNQPIGQWKVSNVTNMSGMFSGDDNMAMSFNQPIGGWNVARVIDMSSMFENAVAFDQPVGGWNVARGANMSSMFDGANSFSQPLTQWRVPLHIIFSPAELKNYTERLNSNVKIARTTEEYISMCLNPDYKNVICPICHNKFIVRGHLVRPVMFHKVVNSRGKEVWSCPVHPEEQVEWGKDCTECRAKLSIPALQIDDIMAQDHEDIEMSEARLRLQSALRGRLTRKSSSGKTVAKKVGREREYRESRRKFHDSYVKRQQAIKQNRAAFNAAFPPSRTRSRSRARSNSMTRSKARSNTRPNRHSAGF